MSTRKKTTKKMQEIVEEKKEEKVQDKKKEKIEENVLEEKTDPPIVEEKKKVVRKKTQVQPPPIPLPVSASVAMNVESVPINNVKKKRMLPVSRSTHNYKFPPFVPSPSFTSNEDKFTEFINLIMKRK